MSKPARLHEAIVSSSIWNEDAKTCKVWVTMLALARNGVVGASIGGLAHSARVSVDECSAALQKFLSPDADSRTKASEGRRIEVVDGGWKIINYRKYSGGRDIDADREQARGRMQRLRGKIPHSDTDVTPKSVEHVRTCANTSEPSVTSEAENPPKRQGTLGFPDGQESRLIPTTDQAKRIAGIMHRRLTTPWSEAEVAAYKKIGKIKEEDMAALEAYYGKHWPPCADDGPKKNILRHDLKTLLNNFQGEVGRAHADAPQKSAPKHEDPEGWRVFLAEKGYHWQPHASALTPLKEMFAKWKAGR